MEEEVLFTFSGEGEWLFTRVEREGVFTVLSSEIQSLRMSFLTIVGSDGESLHEVSRARCSPLQTQHL
jgi:hypothetical protein